MRTARQLFQDSTVFKSYAGLLDNPAFEQACHAALADLVESLPGSAAEPSKAWDSYLQILGARSVLLKLSQLHLKDSAPKPDPIAWQYPKTKGS